MKTCAGKERTSDSAGPPPPPEEIVRGGARGGGRADQHPRRAGRRRGRGRSSGRPQLARTLEDLVARVDQPREELVLDRAQPPTELGD